MIVIQSSVNKQYKLLKGLHSKKNRYKYDSFIIEGIRIVEQALLEEQEILSVFVKTSQIANEKMIHVLNLLESKEILVYQLEGSLFDQVSDTVQSQGIIGIMKMEHLTYNTLLEKPEQRLLILDRIQDPGNLGTMIRTADAAGFTGVLLSKGTVDPYNEKVIRSTMGSIFQIPVIQIEDIIECVSILKDNEYGVFPTALDGAVDYDAVDYPRKTAIIIGNEGNGVDAELLELGTQNVIIPMAGKAESLNASVAASVVMYEVFRQKRNMR